MKRMTDDNEIFILLGAMVEKSLADRFKEQLGTVKTDEAIRLFIEMVAEGKLKLEA